MRKFFFGLLVIFLIASCKSEGKKVGGKQLGDLEVIRFEDELMGLDTTDIEGQFHEWEKKYPAFTEVFFQNVFPVEPGGNFYNGLRAFSRDTTILSFYDLVQKEFGDFSEETEALNEALDNALKWFPGAKKPRIYTYISAFAMQRFIFADTDKDGIGIGLDMFLGDRFDYTILETGENTFSRYLTRTYDKEHLVKKVMESWIEDQMGLQQGDRAIDYMLYNGKKLYLLKQILPEVQDSVLMEYTGAQVEYLDKYQKELWAFYLEDQLFYTTDNYKIKRLVFPAPNSTALQMPPDTPGQTGNYLGLKIVESFMKRNPETSAGQLLSMDAQNLLEQSKFKPSNR